MGSRAQMALSSGQIAPKNAAKVLAKIVTCQSRIRATARCAWTLPCPIHPQSQDFLKHFQIPGKPNTFCCQGNFRSSGHLRRPQTFHPGAGQTNGAARRKPAASPLAGCGGILLLCAQSSFCRHWLPVSKRRISLGMQKLSGIFCTPMAAEFKGGQVNAMICQLSPMPKKPPQQTSRSVSSARAKPCPGVPSSFWLCANLAIKVRRSFKIVVRSVLCRNFSAW